MCGFSGFFAIKPGALDERHARAIRKMTARMTRRGPDAGRTTSDPHHRVVLGFRRLRIIDLSDAAMQPFVHKPTGSMLVFNGEIYNFREVRADLASHGIVFTTQSDTEVVAEALAFWGSEAITRFNGMFAIAWYDAPRQQLLLARDHAGIKPLFYSIDPSSHTVAFASQYDALCEAPWLDIHDINPQALSTYLALHYFPEESALIHNTHQLRAGTYLQFDDRGASRPVTWIRYPRFAPEQSIQDPATLVEQELRNAVQRQIYADVPVCTFLSGGVDSAIVTALAHAQHPDLTAYTLSSPGWWQDESERASLYAKSLGINHKIVSIDAHDLEHVAMDALDACTEPTGDYSMIPSTALAHCVGENHRVVLTGDGGDELFHGYQRPDSLVRDGHLFAYPRWVRRALYYSGRLGLLKKRSSAICANTPGDYYFSVNSMFQPEARMRIAPHLPNPYHPAFLQCNDTHDKETLAAFSRIAEYTGQLDRCLRKVDLSTMHASIEARPVFLDRNIVELSAQLTYAQCTPGGVRKGLLRGILGKLYPDVPDDENKRGFSVPLTAWWRGPLKNMGEQCLFDLPTYPSPHINIEEIRKLWDEHQAKTHNHSWALWTLMSLQNFAQRMTSTIPVPYFEEQEHAA